MWEVNDVVENLWWKMGKGNGGFHKNSLETALHDPVLNKSENHRQCLQILRCIIPTPISNRARDRAPGNPPARRTAMGGGNKVEEAREKKVD